MFDVRQTRSAQNLTAEQSTPKSGPGFNETVFIDLYHLLDAKGVRWRYLAMLDEANDFVVVTVAAKRSAAELFATFEAAWLVWAGPPDTVVTDGEMGMASEEFARPLGQHGSLVHPTLAYSPWQEGRVERRIEFLKQVQAKAIVHGGLEGERAICICGWEAAHAHNHRPGRAGVPPITRLFGQKA